MFVLSIFRNACAHDERLYNLKAVKRNMRSNMIANFNIHSQLGIPVDNSGNPVCGKNDLFAVVIIFKLLLSKNSFNKFLYSIKGEIDMLKKKLVTISIDEVLNSMGFPLNWFDIKRV